MSSITSIVEELIQGRQSALLKVRLQLEKSLQSLPHEESTKILQKFEELYINPLTKKLGDFKNRLLEHPYIKQRSEAIQNVNSLSSTESVNSIQPVITKELRINDAFLTSPATRSALPLCLNTLRERFDLLVNEIQKAQELLHKKKKAAAKAEIERQLSEAMPALEKRVLEAETQLANCVDFVSRSFISTSPIESQNDQDTSTDHLQNLALQHKLNTVENELHSRGVHLFDNERPYSDVLRDLLLNVQSYKDDENKTTLQSHLPSTNEAHTLNIKDNASHVHWNELPIISEENGVLKTALQETHPRQNVKELEVKQRDLVGKPGYRKIEKRYRGQAIRFSEVEKETSLKFF